MENTKIQTLSRRATLDDIDAQLVTIQELYNIPNSVITLLTSTDEHLFVKAVSTYREANSGGIHNAKTICETYTHTLKAKHLIISGHEIFISI